MKNFFFILFIVLSGFVTAQISHGGKPLSFGKVLTNNISLHETTVLNTQQYIDEDLITDVHKDIAWRFGIEQAVNLNLNNSGSWETLPNGDRVWRLEIKSKNALSINLNFSSFQLPKGAQFFVFNQKDVLGAFTESNNKTTGEFSTSPIKGDRITLEYFEPLSAQGKGTIQVSSVVHGYRDFFKQLKAFGSAGPCHINAICDTPFWGNEIRSAVMLLTASNTRFCSGALISNVAKDGTPFVLSAFHCNPQTNSIYMFNYQSPDCTNNIDGITTQTVSGCFLRASDAPSDFELVELSSAPPASYKVFYSGWSNINIAPTKGTGIHFPSSDVKKISHDKDPLIESGYYTAGNDHWEVLDWNSGTTEGGSSGSPLYDQNHRIVGQLHGGDADCGNDAFDYYGKFSLSWDANPTNSNQLKFWLDPTNTGTTTTDGYDPNGTPTTLDAVLLDATDVSPFICGDSISPIITIRNNGSSNLTSLIINYELDAGGVNQINWSGNLPTYAIDTISLPTMYVANGNHLLKTYCGNPNSGLDQNILNDSNQVEFKSNDNPLFGTLHFNTDNFGAESSWIIRDASGSTYFESKGYPSTVGGQSFTESLCLYDSCFTLVIRDSYGDGYCCAAVNGSIYLENNFGDTIYVDSTFSSDSLVIPFCLSTTGINEITNNSQFKIYPNPNQGIFTISSQLRAPYQLKIYNIIGKSVYQNNQPKNKEFIDLTTLHAGAYFILIETKESRIVKRIIIN